MKINYKKAFKVSDVEDHDIDMEEVDTSEIIGYRHRFKKHKKESFKNAQFLKKGPYEKHLETNGWVD